MHVLKLCGVLALAALLGGHSARAQRSNRDQSQAIAQLLCERVFQSKASYNTSMFSRQFKQRVPEDILRGLVQEILAATGPCVDFGRLPGLARSFQYELLTAGHSRIRLSFQTDADGLIAAFQILDVALDKQVIGSWSEAAEVLESWQGRTSLSLVTFAKNKRGIRAKEMQPLGSVFKLYVLGALTDAIADGRFSWQQTFPLREDHTSLPSGVMHTWQPGKMVSLYDYADHMIRISDNTATDHLIHIVGRAAVEAQLTILQNSFPASNTPFLTTAELFKLKWAAPQSLLASYLASTPSERLKIVMQDVAELPLSLVGSNSTDLNAPTWIRDLEWFASTDDICTAMQGLVNKKSPETLDLLAHNVPFIDLGTNQHWSYAGYKGGSEPGVLAMAYLLRSRSGSWGCVAAAWNNSFRPLNQWLFFDAIKKILRLAEGDIH